MIRSSGSCLIISFATVSPPTPESITPIGLSIVSLFTFMEYGLENTGQHRLLLRGKMIGDIGDIGDALVDHFIDDLPPLVLHEHKYDAFILFILLPLYKTAVFKLIHNISRRGVCKIKPARQFTYSDSFFVTGPLKRHKLERRKLVCLQDFTAVAFHMG